MAAPVFDARGHVSGGAHGSWVPATALTPALAGSICPWVVEEAAAISAAMGIRTACLSGLNPRWVD